MDQTGHGACLCGQVKFKTYGKLREVVACHCSQCRKQSGHYWAATDVADEALSLEGEGALTWFYATPGIRRGFCSACGSTLFWKHEAKNYTSIAAGAFEVPTILKLERHIFCADKGDYYEITDGLPCHDKGTADLLTAE